ncbi:MAG: DUF3617 domain-containing protein [Burkholderiaceae bacterium]|nr:DUF3617 domain-containing protein [Burkholderiaceae bacterium]
MRRSGFLYGGIAVAMCLHISMAAAQSLEQRTPGLWELRMDKGSAVSAVLDSMAGMMESLPPAQRKQMEEMLKGSGASMSQPDVIKQCLTPEMAARDFQPYTDDPDMTCTSTSKVISSSAAHLTFSCLSPEGKLVGQGDIWDASAKSYKSKMTMEGSVAGRPVKMDISHEGKWLGADCQGIKPIK